VLRLVLTNHLVSNQLANKTRWATMVTIDISAKTIFQANHIDFPPYLIHFFLSGEKAVILTD
jgi:hypothetical protein